MADITSSRTVETLKTTGRYSAGDGLYLEISKAGRKTWLLRYQLDKKRRDMGLGTYPSVSLADAREAAAAARRQISLRVDPIRAREAAKKASKPLPTFAEISERIIDDVATQSTNEKVRYRATLLLGDKYCKRLLDRPVNSIGVTDIAQLLNRVKATKPETARKLHGLLSKVFETARVILRDHHGVALGDPPTHLKDLKALGYDPRVRNRPLPALDWRDAPPFMAALRQRDGVAFRALELAVLTGLREGEVAGAEWSEIDERNALWTIPIDRLKDRLHRKQPHRVPLSDRALKIIKALRKLDDQWVFPGLAEDRSIAPQSMLEALKKMNADKNGKPIWVDSDSNRRIVVHGFRSTLRTWAEEHGFRREAAEQSLGHAIGNQVEARYRRTDILEERRKLMAAWATYCGTAKTDAKVIPISRIKK